MDLQSIKNFEREQSLVLGKASSQLIYCTVYFNMEFPDRTEAFIISDENDFMFDVELDESDYESVTEKIVAECQPDDEEEIDVYIVNGFVREGKSIFR